MAAFVPKVKLIAQLRQIRADRETGLMTVLGNTDRTVFLRFSEGVLTRLHCRPGESSDAIQTLAESDMVRYTYANAPVDDQAALMPLEELLRLISPGATAD